MKNYTQTLLNNLKNELNDKEEVLTNLFAKLEKIEKTKDNKIFTKNIVIDTIEKMKKEINKIKGLILLCEMELEEKEKRTPQNNKVLILERRGCDFFNDDDIRNISDCENYRITTKGEKVRGKDGNDYFLEFGHSYNKNNNIRICSQIDLIDGSSWRNIEQEAELLHIIKEDNLLYTKGSILKLVNILSIDNYIEVKII